jgi:hypothetical protein
MNKIMRDEIEKQNKSRKILKNSNQNNEHQIGHKN